MDLSLPIDQMTTEEKLSALEAMWESLCRRPNDVPSPSWRADGLRDREGRVRNGSSQFIDWTEATQHLRDSTR